MWISDYTISPIGLVLKLFLINEKIINFTSKEKDDDIISFDSVILNNEQKKAVLEIEKLINNPTTPLVLEGVTGSGKTEVFFEAIETVIKNKQHYKHMLLLRNHGLVGRNTNLLFGYNSRLDTIQAVVANHLLKKIKIITSMRIKNSMYLEKKLKKLKGLNFKTRYKNLKEVFHLYEIRVNNFKIRNNIFLNFYI